LASGGRPAYSGPDGELALQQVRMWTGLDIAGVPGKLLRYLSPKSGNGDRKTQRRRKR
jgi:hypothetical protein